MRKRLYFMVPDVGTCDQLVTELRTVGITEHDIHFIARDDIPLDHLHKASLLQKTELTHGLELGIGVGGIAGMLGGLLAVTFPPAGLALGGGALILTTTLIGAGFGTVVSALVASDIPNHELEAFQSGIAEGQILLILDVITRRIEEMTQLIKTHHSEVIICTTEVKNHF
ncbi:MAG: DUF1269 domain-containing protein [Beggiatoa sp. IS2]|nr:MAG: DUF1269 domain-containing protein [Beggiatoa sp. IS2]